MCSTVCFPYRDFNVKFKEKARWVWHENAACIGLMNRMFANGLEDQGSIPGRHTKDSKMSSDAALLITQHYKLRNKDKVY